MDDAVVLSDSHPVWFERCEPLYLFLREPRTSKELTEWEKSRKISHTIVVQMLAWCENRSLIGFRNGKWAANSPFGFPAVPNAPHAPVTVEAVKPKNVTRKTPKPSKVVQTIEVPKSPRAIQQEGTKQLCQKCWDWKPFEDFPKCSRNQTGIKVYCRVCQKGSRDPFGIAKLSFVDVEPFDPAAPERSRVWGVLLRLLQSSLESAQKQNVYFNLTPEWAVSQWTRQRGRCHVMGVPLEVRSGPFYPVIERVNRLGGYVETNSRIICRSAYAGLSGFEASLRKTA